MPIRVGINGLGRIGRAIFRINLSDPRFRVVAINDVNPDNHNIAYLLKYDSIYGRLGKTVGIDGDYLVVEGIADPIRIYHEPHIDDAPWDAEQVDVVIDSSGVYSNLARARDLKQRNVRMCVTTNSPAEDEVDKTIILGINEESIDFGSDFLIASSICDANAVAPVLHVLDREYGIDHGSLTTLHPWLNYQNLLDGPSVSYASPGHIHDDYTLGRASVHSLIPKTTSAMSATCKVLKNLEGKFMSLSYRVPTMIVSSSDVSVKVNTDLTREDLCDLFIEEQRKQRFNIFYCNREPLVSTDFIGMEYSSIIDQRWLMVNKHNYLKCVCWYDNEWGYSSRVVDLVGYLGEGIQ